MKNFKKMGGRFCMKIRNGPFFLIYNLLYMITDNKIITKQHQQYKNFIDF